MNPKLLLVFLLSGAICEGQSVLTTPAESTQSVPGSASAPSTGAGHNVIQSMGQIGEKTSADSTGTAPSQNLVAKPADSKRFGPPVAKSDFQKFAEDAAADRLPVYGRQLFEEGPSTFAPVDHVPVPADYVIGPGDELLIRVWGKIDLDARVTVDRNGQIALPRIGTLNVARLHFDQLERYLRASVSALFKDFELNVTLGQLRSIQVYILGNARQPGAYTVGSLSTLVNALFASGGPSVTGTMRHIQLRRGNSLVTEFDLYDLAQKGDKSRDVQLLPGDVVYIPPVGPQVAIAGSVSEPGVYELKGESTVSAAIEGAGGLTSLAGVERVLLERIDDHSTRRAEEFPLNASNMQRPLKDGDVLRVFPLSPKFENAVTLRGNVAVPGRYVWKDGMRISDLIPSRASLVTREFWNQENRVPQRLDHDFDNDRDNRQGNQESHQIENGQADRIANRQDSLQVAVRIPTIEMIGKNSAEINWEYAVIERLDDRDLSTRLIPFRLASAIDEPSSSENQALKAGDVITIFSRSDLDLPMEKHASFVRVGGEVNAPGVYRVNPGETLRDVVQRAGGLTSHSYLYASLLTRVSTRRAQEDQLRQSTEQMQRELISRYANATPQAGQSGADQQAQFVMQQASLAKLSSIQPTGRVVLDMKPDAAAITDIPDFPLEDGDGVYIPPRLSTVQVAGAVYNPNAFREQPGKLLIAYLNDAGGATREADRKRIFVVRADGTVISRQSRANYFRGNFEKLALLPGDAIVVPEKVKIASKMNDFLQTTQFLSQLSLSAAALSVIK